MISRVLFTKMWKDEFFAELTPSEKLLFVYFITNERVNIIHCYEITEREIMFDTGIDRGILEKVKAKFEASGKIAFKGNYVFLVNADKYETYKGIKNDVAKERVIALLPKSILDWYNNILNRGMDTVSVKTDTTINHKSEIINHNIGGVRGVESLTDEVIDQVAEDYRVPREFVISKIDDIKNYCLSNGKKYSNYVATLRNWVKKDAIKIKERGVYGKGGFDATAYLGQQVAG